ncbi:MAG: OmpA family protein [Rikenellaceae bacterium]
MRKIIFTTAMLLMSVVVSSVFAQSSNDDDHVVVRTNAIWENWFVSGGVGTTIFAGESDRYGSLGSRLAPAIDISVGKWFTPYMGARLQYSGPQFRGSTYDPDNIFATGSADSDGLYKQKWNSMYFHADAMLNLSNFIGGYKEDRFYSFIPYAGAGWIRAPKSTNDALTVNLGIYNSFKVNSRLDLFFDLRGVIIGEDVVDNEIGGDYGFEGLVTATIGVNFRIGKQGWHSSVSQNTVNNYQSTIKATEVKADNYKKELDKSQKENAVLNKELTKQPKVEGKKEVVAETKIPETVVSFTINSSELSNLTKVNLSNVAKVINESPSSEKYSVVGYADNATGDNKTNNKLSEARANAVYDYLTKECNVEPSRLKVESKGGVDNMFYNDTELSRVVIIEPAK